MSKDGSNPIEHAATPKPVSSSLLEAVKTLEWVSGNGSRVRPDQEKEPPWHSMSAEEAAKHLNVDIRIGLSTKESQLREATDGPNRLLEKRTSSRTTLFLRQFRNILVMVLMLASVLAAAIGNVKDAAIIFAVVVLNAILGFYQEYRAEKSMAALKHMLTLKTHARRDGKKQRIAADALVPGDVVLLQAGDRVPADGRLTGAFNLAIDESTLSGESQPIDKHAATLLVPEVPLVERQNMVYMNTLVTRGRAELVVTATGMRTEIGRLSQTLSSTPERPSPLQIQLNQLGQRLGAIAIVLVGLLFFLEMLRGEELPTIVMSAVALAIAAIPEGLPVVVTVALALGMRRMVEQNAVGKHLASVETLGCTTVICSDKTGTLTLNQMTVRAFFYQGRCFTVTGEGYDLNGMIRLEHRGISLADIKPLFIPLVACNDSRVYDGKVVGDPMEGALLVLAAKGGVNRETINVYYPRIAEIPFDATHKYMATFHQEGFQVFEFVKGAPDVLLKHCTRFLSDKGEVPLDDRLKSLIETEYRLLATHGLRGVLIATRTFAPSEFQAGEDLFHYVSELTFVGLVGLMDPPRPEAKEAIALCNEAGIMVKMITGDHKDTASAVARELGLGSITVTGADLDAMDASRLAAVIDNIDVFARVSPDHKVKIVQALKQRGHVVAVTGDGVNDAPALKHADIGVAMGIAGTEVSKEASNMVLTDDNFATIVSGVSQGRALYDNILKFVRFQLSTTVGAILTVFFAPLAGLPDPFTAIQILWIALIMDGPPAVSLALDSARPGLMREMPRERNDAVLPLPRIAKILMFGMTMMAGTLAVLHHGIRTGTTEHALTLAFTTFVLFQIFNVFNARAENGSAFNKRFFDNPMLWWSIAIVAALQVICVQWNIAQPLFQTTALSFSDWLIAIAVASSVLLLEEGRKLCVFLASRPHS